MLPPTHTRNMENHNKTNATKKSKKGNAMQKIGKSIKNTFIEMSTSLAGWIDDAGTHFAGKKANKTAKKSSTTQQKSSSSQSN